MQTQLLIFDLDGTLVDSRADLTAGINHMRSHYGLGALSLESVSGYVGSGVRDLVERSLRGTDVPLEEALSINRAYYNSHLTVHTTTYPGVCEGIQELSHAGHQLAVLTNKPGDASRTIIKHFGLDDFFISIIGGGDVEKLKPEPDGVFECLAVSGLDAFRAWMLGDHHTDLVAAENAGIRSVFVEYGFGDRLDLDSTVSFDSFPELVRFFLA
jgi:phosphoglycolate phosphatase